MRLATIEYDGGTCAAVLRDGEDAVPVRVDGRVPGDVGELLSLGDAGLDAARRVLEGDHDGRSAELRRPVLDPGAVFCVGLNFGSHADELGRPRPQRPVWFSKLARSLADPTARLPLPRPAVELDYEAEVVAVIGRPARDVAPAEALSYVAGLTLMNDMTARDVQRERSQVFLAKNLDAATPVGPWVTSLDDVGGLDELTVALHVNGEERQSGSLSDLIFSIPELLADLSQYVELRPGDLVATGTPSGVGAFSDPPGLLEPGDVVETSSPPLGRLRNLVGDPVA